MPPLCTPVAFPSLEHFLPQHVRPGHTQARPYLPLVPWQFTDWLSGILGTEQRKVRIKYLIFSSVTSSPVTETQDGGDWQGPLEVTWSNSLCKQGHLEQAAQNHLQMAFEYPQCPPSEDLCFHRAGSGMGMLLCTAV